MSAPSPAERDERTVAVENASYRWSYLVLSFGILILVAYRGLVKHENAWDLLLLVIVGGSVGTIYQGRHRVLTRHWVIASLGAVVGAAILGALMAWFRR